MSNGGISGDLIPVPRSARCRKMFTQLQRSIPILFASIAAVAFADDIPKQDAVPKTISAIIDSAPTITVSRCPGDSQIVAVYSEREPQWWGRLAVYHRSGDSINWPFTFPEAYEEHREHFVVRFRWISLKQTSKPVLEVIGSTHMGNGALRIFEADGRRLRLLLEAKVRGRFWSAPAAFGIPEQAEAHFEGPHLGIEYYCPSDQTVDSILLTGSIRTEDVGGSVLPARKFAQTCVWEPGRRVFIAQPPTSP